MTTGQIVEVAIALALLAAGIWSYRRGGTQGAVLLMLVAAIMLIHGFGMLEYRPSAAELSR